MSGWGGHESLKRRIEAAVVPGQVILTLGISHPNRVVAVTDEGVLVETSRSERRGTGPQLVPARMVTVAWEHLARHGRLRQQELLDDLDVKRSAFVCALLAQLEGVDVESTRPVTLVTGTGASKPERT